MVVGYGCGVEKGVHARGVLCHTMVSLRQPPPVASIHKGLYRSEGQKSEMVAFTERRLSPAPTRGVRFSYLHSETVVREQRGEEGEEGRKGERARRG